MHLWESKDSFLMGKQVLLVFTFGCHSYETLQFLFFVKNKRSGWYPMQGTQQITFPVTVISLCICSFPKGRRFSQPFGDTLCWQRTENLLETTPFSLTYAYGCFGTKQGKQHNCLILQYYLKVCYTCFHWILEKFLKSIILRTVVWMCLRVESPKFCTKICISRSSCAKNVSCSVWWKVLFQTWI